MDYTTIELTVNVSVIKLVACSALIGAIFSIGCAHRKSSGDGTATASVETPSGDADRKSIKDPTLSEISRNLNVISSKIEILNGLVATNSRAATVAETRQALADMQSRLSQLSKEIAKIFGEIVQNEMKAAQKDSERRLAEINAAQRRNAEADEVQTRLTDLETDLTTLQMKVDRLQSRATPKPVPEGKSDATQDPTRTIIFNIGNGPVLTYENGKELRIPIDGQNLHVDEYYGVSVFVKGVQPLSQDRDFTVQNPGGFNQLIVTISSNYFRSETVKSGDPLSVEVRVSQISFSELAQEEIALGNVSNAGTKEKFDALRAGRIAASLLPKGFAQTTIETEKDTNYINSLFEKVTNRLTHAKQDAEQRRSKADGGRTLCTGSRTFVLYATTDYRAKFLQTRVDVPDINAFPLPPTEAKKLFGRFVSENYFVVRLSLRNTRTEDLLVNTGMIKAYGRALVDPESTNEFAFTVPIEVTPQSREHVYTIVQDGRALMARQWIFRSLDFAGALAGALTAAYGGEGAIKAASLATSVGLTGVKNLWPDTVQSQLQNIVNYGMGDLIKVPRRSASLHKYLFFSKGEIEGALPDPLMRGQHQQHKTSSAEENRWKRGAAQVAYLAFDALDIPFETVASPGEDTGEKKVERLLRTAHSTIDSYRNLREDYASKPVESAKFAGLAASNIVGQLQVVTNAIDEVEKNGALSGSVKTNTLAHLRAIKEIVERVRPDNLRSKVLESSSFGESQLTQDLSELEKIKSRLIGGTPSESVAESIDAYEEHLNILSATIEFIKSALALAADSDLRKAVEDLAKAKKDDEAKVPLQILNNKIYFATAFTKAKPMLEGLSFPPRTQP